MERRMPAASLRPFAATLLVTSYLSTTWAIAGSGPILAEYDLPAIDRWNYPFNQTPGIRPNATIFGAFVGENLSPDFDNRDAQFHLAFDTSADVETGLGAAAYHVTAATIHITVSNNNNFRYDSTPDPWQSYLPSDHPEFQSDGTLGRPIEMYGVGFRNGFDALSYQENTPYSPLGPFGKGHRTMYALDYGDDGQPRDVSNNVDDGFDPFFFAIGTTSAVNPGSFVPTGTVFTFEIDVDDPFVQQYLGEQLDLGKLHFMIASLHPASEDQSGSFPEFYCKENELVQFGLVDGAQLSLAVEIVEGVFGDLNGDGVVNVTDLLILLGEWGACPGDDCPADLNGDGVVNVTDLLILLANWG